jgi:excisionase family DNA binding protein
MTVRTFNPEPKEPADLEPLLTLEQVAPLLGYTHWSVRQLVKSGKLRCIRFGQKILLEPSEVRRFLNSARQQGV